MTHKKTVHTNKDSISGAQLSHDVELEHQLWGGLHEGLKQAHQHGVCVLIQHALIMLTPMGHVLCIAALTPIDHGVNDSGHEHHCQVRQAF